VEDKPYNAQCLNGHAHRLSRESMVILFGEEIVAGIDDGSIVSAPLMPRQLCRSCREEAELIERLNAEMITGA